MGALSSGARVASIALVAAGVVALGCRGILGIEERELVDGGGTDAGIGLSCEDYCTAITAACTGDKKQYGSKQVCLGFCGTFDEGKLDDVGKPTLGCRINVLASMAGTLEAADCAAAGPGGNDTCGSNCEAYCNGVVQICPQDFESVGDCMGVCTNNLAPCGIFHVGENTPDNPSVQCRLFHISVAAENGIPAQGMTAAQVTHCPHAMGQGMCAAPDAGMGDCDAGVGP